MEFKLPNINEDEYRYHQTVFVTINRVINTENIFLSFCYDSKIYDSVNDDILYIEKQRRSVITAKELVDYCKIMSQTFLQTQFLQTQNYFHFYGRICSIYDDLYLNQNLSTLEFAFSDIYIRKPLLVIKEIPMEIFKCAELSNIERCPICYERPAILSFNCCSIKYCGNCVGKLYEKQCAQCRKYICISNLKQIITYDIKDEEEK